MKSIDELVHSMQHGPDNFVFIYEGDIDNLWGIGIKYRGSGKYELSQPHLIDRILQVLQLEMNGFETSTNDRLIPAAVQILNKDIKDKPRKNSCNYRTVVGMLSYLQVNTHPDILWSSIRPHVSSTSLLYCTSKLSLALEGIYGIAEIEVSYSSQILQKA